MWSLVRLVAVAVLGVGALLVAGRGEDVLAVVATALRPFDLEVPTGAAGDTGWVPVSVIGVAVGAAAALVRPLDRVVGQLVTVLHELGHTLTAAALGGRPSGIVLRHDASGHATARWSSPGTLRQRTALAVVAFVGAPSAAAAAAAGAQAYLLAGPGTVLWGLAGASAVVTVLARSAWSFLVAAGLAAAAAVALRDAAEPWAASAVVGLVTAVAVRATRVEASAVAAPIAHGDDARVVARHLRLPARFVRWTQAAATVGLSAWSLWLLVAPLRR